MIVKIVFIISTLILLNFNIYANNELNHDIIPVAALFSPPNQFKLGFSPDGKYISYFGEYNKGGGLLIVNSENPKNVIASFDLKQGLYDYMWAYDNRHILYLQSKDNQKSNQLYIYDLETKQTTLLTPESEIKVKFFAKRINKSHKILIGLKSKEQQYFDIYELNLLDYTKKLIMKNNKFVGFLIDNDLNIRVGIYKNNKGEEEYFQFKNNKWVFLMKLTPEDIAYTGFHGFDASGNNIYLLDGCSKGTVTLKLLNLNNGKMKLLAEDAKADINILAIHPTTKEIQAVVTEYDKVTYKILDASIKEDVEYLKRLNLGNMYIMHRGLDDKIWIVGFDNDVKPFRYYKYNRENKEIKLLFSSKSELEKYSFAPMNPVIIKSRDGLDLVSYITLPNNIELSNKIYPNKPLPLVLLVHGGPNRRDRWGMNKEHQWLASRGYVVLSVNFRGSTGFGKSFQNAGNREWGGKMQDDLVDAVNWAIKNKIADPKRIAIMGSSYGGYAVLAGLTFTPELFACGIDVAGPPDLIADLKNFPKDYNLKKNPLEIKIGSYKTRKQREKLIKQSPITYANNITKPLLIIQGAKDSVVKQSESDKMVEAMSKYNIPVIYALYKNEGHSFCDPYSKISYHYIAERFLAKHLGGKFEAFDYRILNSSELLLNGCIPSEKLLEDLLNK
ncbi:alpha/beta hydrolase family protein [Rickettsia bellii]|uniref:Dipeptidyl aminopeptidase/acylaminoacyl-peptidase n=1 Tax=Rickettsia bellii (strain RML369-C) TaxID=336407 RepID=Q1RJB2_RICBR|nr:S9 family peptidase [Rickettsia bellii]ABE04552.1 Dipeptidyl aminopeptidase/acylaminoacyl-peptidase [Rickettsia bellii RML369-C]